jgi:hypothetical protein
MATSQVFEFTDSKSGMLIRVPPETYYAVPGWDFCITGKNTQTGQIQTAFFSFDTSSLPDAAFVTRVEFQIITSGVPTPDPLIYGLGFSIGTFIGPVLDGNAEEWNGGAYMVLLGSRPVSGTWLDLSQAGGNPCPFVNLTGDTDIRAWDDSIGDLDHWYWVTDFNTKTSKCKLRVTYVVPHGSCTGRGAAAAAAGVEYRGQGMASGRGSAQVAARAEMAGQGKASGVGKSQAQGWAEVFGALGGIGRGTARAVAEVRLEAGATATGIGTASCRLTSGVFKPVAVHCASRSVQPAHEATRSVASFHHGVCSAQGGCNG